MPPALADGVASRFGRDGRRYPLRPEFAESVLFMYQMTRDDAWREIGKVIVDTLDLVYGCGGDVRVSRLVQVDG